MWSNISPSDSSLLPLSHFYSRNLARCLRFFADRYYSYYSYYHSKYVQMGSLPSVVIKELRIITPKEQNYVYSNFAQVAGNPDSSFIWIQCFCPLAAWNNDKLLQVLFLPDTWEQSLLQENQILTIQQTLAVSREWGGEWQVLDIPLNLAPKDFEFWTQLSTTHITLGAPSPPAECIKIRRTYSQQYTFAYLNESSCMQYLGTLHMLLAFPGFEGLLHSESGLNPWPPAIITEVGLSCQISTCAISCLDLKTLHTAVICTWNLDLRIIFIFPCY